MEEKIIREVLARIDKSISTLQLQREAIAALLPKKAPIKPAEWSKTIKEMRGGC